MAPCIDFAARSRITKCMKCAGSMRQNEWCLTAWLIPSQQHDLVGVSRPTLLGLHGAPVTGSILDGSGVSRTPPGVARLAKIRAIILGGRRHPDHVFRHRNRAINSPRPIKTPAPEYVTPYPRPSRHCAARGSAHHAASCRSTTTGRFPPDVGIS